MFPFLWLQYRGVGEGATPFPGLLNFTLDPYLIMLSVKQGGIKYHLLSLWYVHYVNGTTRDCVTLIGELVFVIRPTKRKNVAQGCFRWARSQSSVPDASGSPKNASNPAGIPLKRDASGARRLT